MSSITKQALEHALKECSSYYSRHHQRHHREVQILSRMTFYCYRTFMTGGVVLH